MSPIKRIILASSAMLATLTFISACGSSGGSESTTKKDSGGSESTTKPDDTGSVLVVDGVEYTCAEVINAPECDDETQAVFDEYKDNLEAYTNSGKLGPLNDGSYENAAYAGLAACVLVDEGEQVYIETLQEDAAFEELSGTELLPAWFEAQNSLCPTDGSQSTDMTTP